MNDTIETCRHLYNDSLKERNAHRDLGFYEQRQMLPLKKKDNKYYKQVHSQVLQNVLVRLDGAYHAFFKRTANYPKLKRKGKYNSFTYPQHGGFRIRDNKLVLSYIGSIKFKMHRTPVGKLKTCAIIKDIGQWYCCLTTDESTEKLACSKLNTSKSVGIDAGLLNWLTLSNGVKIENQFESKTQMKKIKQLQRNVSRKRKGSKNREKARVALAKVWRGVRRRREDFLHKTSKLLADEYTLVIFERLNIHTMVENHCLAQAIMDATWSKLRLYTTYKVERRSGQVILVNPSGTSQRCSRCEMVEREKIDLSVRTFECRSCGLVIDRDLNAARNILKLGLEQARAEKPPLLVRQRTSKFASRKQEAHTVTSG